MNNNKTYKVKVCGMKYSDNIKAVANLNPDYMGFIFYDKSKRFVGENNVAIQQFNNSTIQKVGVFVNATQEYIIDQVEKYRLNIVQLHGNETVEFCKNYKLSSNNSKLIKAFQIDASFDFATLEPYKPYVDYFLFDTKSKQYGGTGKQFDWTLLKDYDNEIPLFLSGGIGSNDAKTIANSKELEQLNIHAVDINSCFETKPAMKDAAALNTFITTVKHAIHS